MLVPYREIGAARERQAEAALMESKLEPVAIHAAPISEIKRYRMQHPDRPVTRRWNFTFACNGVELRAVNGVVEVDAATAAVLERAGWLRKEAV